MTGMTQSLRPKHQILILKCYPRSKLDSAEVKPNSSELSYLLYYCSTRRSKLQKVGAFLEKRTSSDVRRGRLSDIQVTLQIVAALIEKCPRDLALYSPAVLAIFSSILQSHDIGLVEETVTAFSTFCAYYDATTLAGDQSHTRHFEDIINTYASFASKDAPTLVKGKKTSIPIAIRFRNAGLNAIKGLVSSESFGVHGASHVKNIVPVIMENVYSEQANYLLFLQDRGDEKEQHDKEQAYRRRQSVALNRVPDTQAPLRANENVDVHPSFASGTTADSDQRANDDVGVLALSCLRYIFAADNRGQLRLATDAAVAFIVGRNALAKKTRVDYQAGYFSSGGWSVAMFETICNWPPVQDRFIVMVTAVEKLIRSPIREDDLENQLTLTDIIDWALKSNVNFIGLTVMDVLLGIVQHILLLLQLGNNMARPARTGSAHSRAAPKSSATFLSNPLSTEIVEKPSAPRLELLERLQNCIGDLATHIYYSDQVSDMLSALLLRLKPSVQSAVAAVENPDAAVEAIADSANIQEKPRADGYFSFDTARQLALQTVKRILVVANSAHTDRNSAGRNRVHISVWEGTQWLLRDPDGRVRKAYVDALLTWLSLELDKKSLRLVAEHVSRSQSKKKREVDGTGSELARRALSTASQRLKTQTRARGSFLQLLHLAIFENALQFSNSEGDVLLLHLLLSALISKLGINSVRVGLPMVFALQEYIPSFSDVISKITIGSLAHGYFWALTESFEIESSVAGRQIHAEIIRRSSKGFWVKSVQMPPIPLEHIGSLARPSEPPLAPAEELQKEVLRPFDAREELVDSLADAYANSVASPPTSPPGSPGRSYSLGTIITRASMLAAPTIVTESLPSTVKEQMLTPWSREACIAAVEKESARTASLSGSKSGSASGTQNRQYLNTNGAYRPSGNEDLQLTDSNGIAIAYDQRHRNPSANSSRTPVSMTSVHSTIMHVSDLKNILAGKPAPNFSAVTSSNNDMIDDAASDSIASEQFDMSTTHSLPTAGAGSGIAITTTGPPGQAITTDLHDEASTPDHFTEAPQYISHTNDSILELPEEDEDDDIPPVPMLPENLRPPKIGSPFAAGVEKQLGALETGTGTGTGTGTKGARTATSGAASYSGVGAGWGARTSGIGGEERMVVDLKSLLSGIDTTPRRPTSSIGAPPY